MSFEDLMRSRSASEYADFVLPSIRGGDRVIDVGCGPGSITIGLAQAAGHVTGVDVDDAEFADARAYAAEHGIDNVEFLEGSIYRARRSPMRPSTSARSSRCSRRWTIRSPVSPRCAAS